MPLDIVRGKISNIVATKELIKIVEQHGNHECSETLYLGYPLSANAERTVTVDALSCSIFYIIHACWCNQRTRYFPYSWEHFMLDNLSRQRK